MPKIHGNTGVPKSRRHRERLAAAGRVFWQRAHEALRLLDQQQQQDVDRV